MIVITGFSPTTSWRSNTLLFNPPSLTPNLTVRLPRILLVVENVTASKADCHWACVAVAPGDWRRINHPPLIATLILPCVSPSFVKARRSAAWVPVSATVAENRVGLSTSVTGYLDQQWWARRREHKIDLCLYRQEQGRPLLFTLSLQKLRISHFNNMN